MRIGEVADQAGVNVQTLRYYERRGLLEPPPRTPSGYRIYGMETVNLVRFIKRVQELGFSLTDVEDLLSLREDSRSDTAKKLTEEKLEGIRSRIQDLQAMDAALTHLLTKCETSCEQICDPEELLVSAVTTSETAHAELATAK